MNINATVDYRTLFTDASIPNIRSEEFSIDGFLTSMNSSLLKLGLEASAFNVRLPDLLQSLS